MISRADAHRHGLLFPGLNYEKFLDSIKEGNDRQIVTAPIRKPTEYPPIKICAPDFSYTMDIMFMNEYAKIVDDSIVYHKYNRKENAYYTALLVLIETMSRKLFLYPLKTKSAEEVFGMFQAFLHDVGNKIANLTSDAGKEYSMIKAFNDRTHMFNYYQCVASAGNHTTLSLVDRVTRTLRENIMQYHAQFNKPTWIYVMKLLERNYNNKIHGSLWIYGVTKKGTIRKFYYTPNQVWFTPILRDRLRKRINAENAGVYNLLRDKFKIGAHVFESSVPRGPLAKGMKRGYLSNKVHTITGRIGNSFELDDEKIVPYNQLFLSEKQGPRMHKIKFNIPKDTPIEGDPRNNISIDVAKLKESLKPKKKKRFFEEVANLPAKRIRVRNKKYDDYILSN